ESVQRYARRAERTGSPDLAPRRRHKWHDSKRRGDPPRALGRPPPPTRAPDRRRVGGAALAADGAGRGAAPLGPPAVPRLLGGAVPALLPPHLRVSHQIPGDHLLHDPQGRASLDAPRAVAGGLGVHGPRLPVGRLGRDAPLRRRHVCDWNLDNLHLSARRRALVRRGAPARRRRLHGRPRGAFLRRRAALPADRPPHCR
ncbi:hypothetical protein EMIHUDRAFT_445946, partial [Emiliania huxleyi CCMP1516]|uniref:Uncharacterized protein n=2 Tax=Emiliania huxleyi TaxID=2903 RepID=A0A0D3INA1_EMIH1